MRNTLLIFISLCSLLILNSCEESFSPKTDFRQNYVLNCIVRADTNYQTATISKSFNVDGYDPSVNKQNPFLSGADIRIWQKDSVYIFNGSSTTVKSDSLKYDHPIPYYYVNNFSPVYDKELEIRAILPNGKTLTGFTKIPKEVEFSITSTPKINSEITSIFYGWTSENYGIYYQPRYYINYRKSENGNQAIHIQPVPIGFATDGTPIYPTVNGRNKIIFTKEAFDYAMRQISKDDPKKSSYTIYGAILEVLVFDSNLSKYFSNTKGFLDNFTVRLDQNDYTNIDGGFGVFGSFIKQKRGSLIEASYIESFGYKAGNP